MTPKLFGHNRIYQQESLLNKHFVKQTFVAVL